MIRVAAAILAMLALLVPTQGAARKARSFHSKAPVKSVASRARTAGKPATVVRKTKPLKKRVTSRQRSSSVSVRRVHHRGKSAARRTRAVQVNFAVQEPAVTGLQCALGATAPGEATSCVACSEQALGRAHALVGLRYRRGGTSIETGFDCSGFVQHVFGTSCQLRMPRSASEQYQVGLAVSRNELQRGDLVFFRGRRGWHVGIYTGDGNFIHSPNRRESVKVSSLDSPYFRRTYLGARRLTHDIIEPLPAEAPAESAELSDASGLN